MATQTYDWQRGTYVSSPGFLRQPSGGQAWPPSPSKSLRAASDWPSDPPPLLPSTPAHQLPVYNSPSQALVYPGALQTHARSSSSSSSSSALSTPKSSTRAMPVLLPGSPTFQHPSHGYDQIWVPPPGTTDEAPRRYVNIKTGKLIPPDQVPPHLKMITAPPPPSPKTPRDQSLALALMVPESPSAGLFPMPLPGEARSPPKALPPPRSAQASPAPPSLHITPASPPPGLPGSPSRSQFGSPRSASRQATPHASPAPSVRGLSSPSRPQSTPPLASPRSPAPSLRSVSKQLSPARSHARSPLASPAPSISEMLDLPPGSPMSLVGPSPLRTAIRPPHSPTNDSDSDASVGGQSVVSLLRSPPRSPTQVPLPNSPSNSVRSALSPVPVGARSPTPGSVRSPTGSVRSVGSARSPPPGSVRSASASLRSPPPSIHSPSASVRSPPPGSVHSPAGSVRSPRGSPAGSVRSPPPSLHSPTGSMRALTPTQGSRAPSIAGSLRDAASPTGSARALSPSKWGSPRSPSGSLLGAGTPRQDNYTPSRTEVALPEGMRSLEADLSLLPDVPWKEFPRWAQTSRNESYLRLIASNRDVEEKYQADVAAYRAEGKDVEELAIQRHLKLTRNGEVEVRRLLKDLQVRFLLQRKTEEYETWESDFKDQPPDFIVHAIQQIYVGHDN